MSLAGEAELPDDAIVEPDAGTARLTEVGTLNVEIPKDGAVDDADFDPAGITAAEGEGTEDLPVDDADESDEPEADEITIDD